MELPSIGQTFSRNDMPQIDNHKGFISFLKRKDIKVTEKTVPSNTLKSSQLDFDAKKILGIISNGGNDKRIFVSNDNHVVDGHHRWLANALSDDPVMVYEIDLPVLEIIKLAKDFSVGANLNESVTHKEFGPMMDSFVEFASDKLGIKSRPTISYKNGLEGEQPSFGGYNPSDNSIQLHTKNRHPLDVLRTLAHELVHHKQNEDGRIKDVAKEGSTGSPIENEANATAGQLMRWFGKSNADAFHWANLTENLATFVVGVPCSGKDRIIKTLKESDSQEIDINSIPKIQKIAKHIIINAPAELYEEVIKAKELLEYNGYLTEMVFVSVPNEISSMRNKQREQRGQRMINENIRYNKYNKSMENLEKFRSLFEMVHVIENTPSDREWGKTSLRKIYTDETPGQVMDEGSKKKKKNRIKITLSKGTTINVNIPSNGIYDNAAGTVGIPSGPGGLGDEFPVSRVPGMYQGLAESVVKWATKPDTIRRFEERYGAKLFQDKLLETAKKLNEACGDNSNKSKKTFKQVKEGLGLGATDMGTVASPSSDSRSLPPEPNPAPIIKVVGKKLKTRTGKKIIAKE